MAGQDRRDDLGIGGDGPGDAQPVLDLQVGVVVDIAIQRSHHIGLVGATGGLELFRVAGVAVGLADDAHTRPARVAEHRHTGGGVGQGQAQQRIAVDGGAQRTRVVAEFTDCGSGFVHQAEARAGQTHRPALEQRVVGTLGNLCRYRRVGGAEAVAPHVEVQPGRVAAAHFHAIDGRQRLLYGEVRRYRSSAGIAPGEVVDGQRSAEAIVAYRPHSIAQGDDFGADALDFVGYQIGRCFEHPFSREGTLVESVEAGRERHHQFTPADERLHTGHTVQQRVATPHESGCLDHGLGGYRTIEQVGELTRLGPRSRGGPAEDSDDAAHDPNDTDQGAARTFRGSSSKSLAHHGCQGSGGALGEFGCGGFHHHPDERFGTTGSHQHPPIATQCRCGGGDVGRQFVGHMRMPFGHGHIGEHLRVAVHHGGRQLVQCAPLFAYVMGQAQAGQQTIARGGHIGVDDVAALFATHRETAGGQCLDRPPRYSPRQCLHRAWPDGNRDCS